jgi:hypothetical protein
MDMDELATPSYQVLSPATKNKLATQPKGELMVRHPHFTQPVFLRFPRPPVLTGPSGLAKFPPAADVPFEEAVVRHLVALDRGVAPNAVKDAIADRSADDVRQALMATRRTAPDDVLKYFRAALGPRVVRGRVEAVAGRPVPLRSVEDPYAP